MTAGLASNFKIYDDQINGGLIETLVQETNAFNAASRGAIRLIDNRLRGDYMYDSFFQNISGVVSRRDTTSVASATDLSVSQDEFISVKLNRKIGPVAQTLDAFRKIGRSGNEQSLSFLIGTQIAKAMMVDKVNVSMSAMRAALANQSTNITTVDSFGTMTTGALVDGLALMGDMANRVVLWVMHSKVYYDLVQQQITANIDGVSNFNVASATPVTLNRPVLVTDETGLTQDASPDTNFFTLGLVPGAATLENSEEELIHAELVTGLENLVVRLQGEFAYNVGLKGFKWDVANGGANPTVNSIATGSNWDSVMASYKDLAGVVIQSR